MQSKATTVQAYIDELPADRKSAISAIRNAILSHLDSNCEEGMQYGMIGYYVPHRVYPKGYHCDPKQPLPFAALASQKGYISIYLMSVYMQEEEKKWFLEEWAKTGKKLDMGKSCIRVKRLEDVPLEVISRAIQHMPAKKYIEIYERNLRSSKSSSSKPVESKSAVSKSPSSKATAKKSSVSSAVKKSTVKKATVKKATTKKPIAKKVAVKSPSPKRAVGKKVSNKKTPKKPAK